VTKQLDLISPLAQQRAHRHRAPRLQKLTGRIILSDSMLNVTAGWGKLILDSVGSALPEDDVLIERISRPQIGDHRPQEWVDHLVEDRVSAVVVTAGDCATCTSRALRECILAEDSGIAATAIIPIALNEITNATLTAWGRPDLQIATFDTPLFALKKEDFPEVMKPITERVLQILTSQ